MKQKALSVLEALLFAVTVIAMTYTYALTLVESIFYSLFVFACYVFNARLAVLSSIIVIAVAASAIYNGNELKHRYLMYYKDKMIICETPRPTITDACLKTAEGKGGLIKYEYIGRD